MEGEHTRKLFDLVSWRSAIPFGSSRQEKEAHTNHPREKRNSNKTKSETTSTTTTTRKEMFGTLVVCSQVAFLLVGYLHAWYEDLVDWSEPPHISAVLDDTTRSLLCSAIALFSLWALRGLEYSRTINHPRLRLWLANTVGLGILGVCVVRESHWWALHAALASVVFVAGWILVMVVTSCHPGAWKSATALSALTLVVGGAQGLSIAQQLGHSWAPALSSTALAVGECALIVTFSVCVVTISGSNENINTLDKKTTVLTTAPVAAGKSSSKRSRSSRRVK